MRRSGLAADDCTDPADAGRGGKAAAAIACADLASDERGAGCSNAFMADADMAVSRDKALDSQRGVLGPPGAVEARREGGLAWDAELPRRDGKAELLACDSRRKPLPSI